MEEHLISPQDLAYGQRKHSKIPLGVVLTVQAEAFKVSGPLTNQSS